MVKQASNPVKKVLFLGHEASRTGAPLLLLELIRWLAKHSNLRPSVLLKRGGELESDFRAIAPTWCFGEECERMNRGLRRRLFRKLRLLRIRKPNLVKLYPAEEYPVIYANTIETCDLALQLIGPGRRLIMHVHELAYGTSLSGLAEVLKTSVSVTNVYIAASDAVADYLIKDIGVSREKIQVIHEFPVAVGSNGASEDTRQSVRRRLQISENTLVVGMCGGVHWRKGPDLFVQLAMHTKRRLGLAKCLFLWLGGSSSDQREILHEIAQAGLKDVCRFITAVPNPQDYFCAFDLFALTSREDPFSVAMLEAAASGLPIVCFACAGGAPELVEKDAGIIVPYLDIPAMADACTELLLDEERRRKLGEKARAKVLTRYTIALQAPKILTVLESLNCGTAQNPIHQDNSGNSKTSPTSKTPGN